MASPQNDFIVAPETNQAPLPIEPLALVTQHYTAENLSLPLQEQNHHLLSKTLTSTTSQTILFVRWKTTIMRLTISEGYEYFYFNNTTKDWTTSTVPLTKIMTTVRTCMVYLWCADGTWMKRNNTWLNFFLTMHPKLPNIVCLHPCCL